MQHMFSLVTLIGHTGHLLVTSPPLVGAEGRRELINHAVSLDGGEQQRELHVCEHVAVVVCPVLIINTAVSQHASSGRPQDSVNPAEAAFRLAVADFPTSLSQWNQLLADMPISAPMGLANGGNTKRLRD